MADDCYRLLPLGRAGKWDRILTDISEMNVTTTLFQVWFWLVWLTGMQVRQYGDPWTTAVGLGNEDL